MKKRILFSCHLIAVILISTALTSHAKKVNYHAQGKWGGECNTGANQSPIDIIPNASPNSSTITFKGYGSFGWTAQPKHAPNWEAVVLSKPAPSFTVTIAGKKHIYELESLHFHSPGEHRIKGKPFEMELHLVHKRKGSSKDKAVIAILFESGGKNPTLERFLKTNSSPAGEPMRELPAMLDTSRGYYTYDGSLTTPDCDEVVKWFVLGRTATVSAAQIKAFKGRMGSKTNRNLQKPNDRPVYYRP